MRKASWVILAAFFLVGAAWVSAKPAANVVQGRVVNSKDEPVPAARVFIQSGDGSAPHAFRADADGHFSRVVWSRKGLYDVRAEAEGLWSEWQHNVSVRSTAKSEIVLKLVRSTPPAAPRPINNK